MNNGIFPLSSKSSLFSYFLTPDYTTASTPSISYLSSHWRHKGLRLSVLRDLGNFLIIERILIVISFLFAINFLIAICYGDFLRALVLILLTLLTTAIQGFLTRERVAWGLLTASVDISNTG